MAARRETRTMFALALLTFAALAGLTTAQAP
jgi:hypothetical protein